MFFVFESGNAQDGEANGGLGDMERAFESLDDAKAFAEENSRWIHDVDILNGSNGDTITKNYRKEGWEVEPFEDFAQTNGGI